MRFSELENQRKPNPLLLTLFSGYVNTRTVAAFLQIVEFCDNLRFSSNIIPWNSDLISFQNWQQVYSVRSWFDVRGIFSRTTIAPPKPLNRRRFSTSSMSAAKIVKTMSNLPLNGRLASNLLGRASTQPSYLYHSWFLGYAPYFFETSFDLFTPYTLPNPNLRLLPHLLEASETFTHTLWRSKLNLRLSKRLGNLSRLHSLDSRFLRRKSFLNLVGTLTRKIRVVSHNAGFVFMSRPFMRLEGVVDLFGEVQKISGYIERQITALPLGLRPLSFLNRFDIRDVVNIDDISPVKTGMLMAFYESYSHGHYIKGRYKYNPLPALSPFYWDYRVIVLRFGGFENLFWLNNFKQFPQNFFSRLGSGTRILSSRVWGKDKSDLGRLGLRLHYLLNLLPSQKTLITPLFRLRFSHQQARFDLIRQFTGSTRFTLHRRGLLTYKVRPNVLVQNLYSYMRPRRLRARILNTAPVLFSGPSRPRYIKIPLNRTSSIQNNTPVSLLYSALNLKLTPPHSLKVLALKRNLYSTEPTQLRESNPSVDRRQTGYLRSILRSGLNKKLYRNIHPWWGYPNSLFTVHRRLKTRRTILLPFWHTSSSYLLKVCVLRNFTFRLRYLRSLSGDFRLNSDVNFDGLSKGARSCFQVKGGSSGMLEVLNELVVLVRSGLNESKYSFKQYLLKSASLMYLQSFGDNLKVIGSFTSQVLLGPKPFKRGLSRSRKYERPSSATNPTFTYQELTLKLQTSEGREELLLLLQTRRLLPTPTHKKSTLITPSNSNLKINLLLQCRRGNGWMGKRMTTLPSLRSLFLNSTLWHDFLHYKSLTLSPSSLYTKVNHSSSNLLPGCRSLLQQFKTPSSCTRRVYTSFGPLVSSTITGTPVNSSGQRPWVFLKESHQLKPILNNKVDRVVVIRSKFMSFRKTLSYALDPLPVSRFGVLGEVKKLFSGLHRRYLLPQRRITRGVSRRMESGFVTKIKGSQALNRDPDFILDKFYRGLRPFISLINLFFTLQVKNLVLREQRALRSTKKFVLDLFYFKISQATITCTRKPIKHLQRLIPFGMRKFIYLLRGGLSDKQGILPPYNTPSEPIMSMLGLYEGNPLHYKSTPVMVRNSLVSIQNSLSSYRFTWNPSQSFTGSNPLINLNPLKRQYRWSTLIEVPKEGFGYAIDSGEVATVFTNILGQKFGQGLVRNMKQFFGRMFLTSRYDLPFIFSSVGFLFLSSNDSDISGGDTLNQDKAMIASRVYKHRLSFFDKNELKRIYLRKPGFLKLVTSFFSDDSLVDQDHLISNYLRTPGMGSGCRPKNIASKYFSTSMMRERGLNFSRSMEVIKQLRSHPELKIKRVRFKPGYQRVWRKARSAINYTLKYNCRYQVGLTKRLARVRRSGNYTRGLFKDVTLENVLIYSQFVFDTPTSKHLLQSRLVHVNGSRTSNPSLGLFVGDFVQLEVNLRYYITYRWLISWNDRHNLRFTKLLNYKNNNTSHSDLSKQASYLWPDWVFFIGHRRIDIPNYLEVDFFTLSSFMIYRPLYLTDRNFFVYFDDRSGIHDMYNWKFIS